MVFAVQLGTPETQAELGRIMASPEPMKVELLGKGPILLSPSGNIEHRKVIDGSAATITEAEIDVSGTGYLWRNLVLENWNVHGDLVIDGGNEDRDTGGYECIYSMSILRPVVNGRVALRGAVFESQWQGGRVEIPVGSPLEALAEPLVSLEGAISSFTFYGEASFSGGVGVRQYASVTNVKWHDCTFLRSKGTGLLISNNIGGSVSNCHFEENNLLISGPALSIGNVVRVENAVIHPGPKTAIGVSAYSAKHIGSVTGFVFKSKYGQPVVPVDKNSWRVMSLVGQE